MNRPASAQEMLPGLVYTFRQTTTIRGPASSIVGRVAWAQKRGRFDIEEGPASGPIRAGDHILFDEADFIVVHPKLKTYSLLTLELDAGRPSVTRRRTLNAFLENLGHDTAVGYAAEHFRLHYAYATTLDMSAAGISTEELGVASEKTERTVEYWYADVPDMPPHPLRKLMNQSADMLGQDVDSTLATARAALPTNKALVKLNSVTRSSSSRASRETTLSFEAANLHHESIRASELLLPVDFVEDAQGKTAGQRGHAAKWQVLPQSVHKEP